MCTKRHARQGFGLLELLIATSVGSILLISTGMLISFSARSFAAMTNYVDLDSKSRKALDRITRDIRQANGLTSFTDRELVLQDWDNQPLRYTFNPETHQLTRTKDATEVMLTECDFLRFDTFQRNPVGGSYDQYPTAVAATCKVIQLSWVCSRRILGAKINTESVQSAKVVIRKQ